MDRSTLSRKEIANRAGIAESGLYKLIRAKDIKVGTLMKILKAIDLPWEAFFVSEIYTALEDIKLKIIRLQEEAESLRESNKLMDQLHHITRDYFDAMEVRTPGASKYLRLKKVDAIEFIPLDGFMKIMNGFYFAQQAVPRRTDRIVRYLIQAINVLEYRKYFWRSLMTEEYEVAKSLTKLIRRADPEEYIDEEKLRKALKV